MHQSTRARLAIALSAVVAVGGVGCGSSDGTEVRTEPPPDGRYAGQTSQGLPIQFVVVEGAVHGINFGWRARCEDGQVHSNTIALPGGGIEDGAFSSGGGLETGGIAHVDGEFDGKGFSGELSRSRGSAFGTDCRATGIGWDAELVEGTPEVAPL